MYDLRQMKSRPMSCLSDLLAAAKAVGNDQGVFGGIANGGKQHPLTAGNGNFIMIFLKAKGACHAAAARIENLEIKP
jgi:hypothetical protein